MLPMMLAQLQPEQIMVDLGIFGKHVFDTRKLTKKCSFQKILLALLNDIKVRSLCLELS